MANYNVEITYAERAGMCLKAYLVNGRRNASKAERLGYRDRIAEKLCVDPRTLSRYCNAIHDVDTIAQVSAVIGVSIGDMLSYDGEDIPDYIKILHILFFNRIEWPNVHIRPKLFKHLCYCQSKIYKALTAYYYIGLY